MAAKKKKEKKVAKKKAAKKKQRVVRQPYTRPLSFRSACETNHFRAAAVKLRGFSIIRREFF